MTLALLGGHTVRVELELVVLLAVACVIAILARRLRLPYTIGLVGVGLIAGLVTHVPAIHLSSDLVYFVLLPTLLFEASVNLEARFLRELWRPIAVLAVVGVMVAFALTATGLRFAGQTTWTIAALFAALIAATDPVSVVAVFRRLGVSERLTTLIDAESLFNDGTAAVVFAIVVTAVTGSGHTGAAWDVGRFLWMTAGGIGVGVAVGYLASLVHRFVDDYLVEITMTTIAAYGSFLLAHELRMSGVVACVIAGVVIGNFGRATGMSPTTRVTMGTTWEYAAFLANSVIFLLVGLKMALGTILDHLGLVALAFVITVAARMVTIYGYGLVTRFRGRRLLLKWQHLLVWGGLRGTIALALVLSVPASVAGRDTLQVLTFGVVLLSLLIQGLTIPTLARRLGLVGGEEAAAEMRRRQLLDSFVAAHEELDRLEASRAQPDREEEHAVRTVERQEAALLAGLGREADEPSADDTDRLAARVAELTVQREHIAILVHAAIVEQAAAQRLVAQIEDRIALLSGRLRGGPLPADDSTDHGGA
jgi:CPA1 family monovalent cation:H+ antiporter